MDPALAGRDKDDPRYIPTVASKDLKDENIPDWLRALDAGQLTELDLESRYAGVTRKGYEGDSGIDIAVLERMCQILAFDENLERLSLRRCNINDPGLEYLGRALHRNNTLTELDIRENNLTSRMLTAFSVKMQSNYMLHICKVEEHAKDMHAKNAMRHEAFTLNTVDTLLQGEAEDDLFARAWDHFVKTVLIPNRDNNRTLDQRLPPESRSTVLNFGGRTAIDRPLMQTYMRMCKDHLRVLALDACGLDIPITLVKLKQLDRLYLNNNPIQKPAIPSKIWDLERDKNREGRAVLEYCRELFADSRIVNRCKLMFVGDGGVGKTSLVKSLKTYTTNAKLTRKVKKAKGGFISMQEPNVATDGIEVNSILVDPEKKIKASKGDERKIEFSLWDFAGQEVYYATHQFFLSERSVYVVCCNMEKQDEYSISRIEHWLLSLSARAPNAPVIIVCSHYAETKEKEKDYFKNFKEMLESRFKSRFKTLIDIFPVSNDSLKGLDDIISGIVKIALSNRYKKKLGIEEERPVSWLELEEKARGLRTTLVVPVYSWSEWKQLAIKGCGIQTEEGVLLATEFLHDLGSVIYFNSPESGLHDLVILDPEWLTAVFASVVSAKHDPKYGLAGAVRGGLLKHSDLDFIWKPPLYPSSLHPFLLAVLEKFEVLHRLEGKAVNNTEVSSDLLFHENNVRTLVTNSPVTVNSGLSLIPSLLSEQRPPEEELRKVWPDAALKGQAQIGRYYQFQFLPNGFFSRLMVRILHSDWMAKLYWRYGVILYKQESMLRLELDYEKNGLTIFFFEILIPVRGSAGANKMGSLIESINTLISDWLSVEVVVKIPCIGCFAKGHSRPYHFSVEEAEQAAARGDLDIQCRGPCGDKIRLDLLVPDMMMTDSAGVGGKRIQYSDISIGPEIGRGGFAIVYKGHYQGRMVAVKQLMQESQIDGEVDALDDRAKFSDYFAEFRREVWLMSGMHHRNIVQLIGVCTQPLCMVLEFCGDGDLYSWIHKKGAPASLDDITLREKLALDISQGMEFLHSTTPPIIHRDLKSPNILLATDPHSRQLECKIADFGLSRGLVWSDKLEGKVVDNPIWLAPEVLRHHKYTEKVDVYAFGVILWELISAEDFFGDISFMSTIEDKIKNGDRPQIPPYTPEYLQRLIETCWDDKPSVRPSFRQLSVRIKSRDARVRDAAEEARLINDSFYQDETMERAKRAKDQEELASLRAQRRAGLKGAYTSTRRKRDTKSDVAPPTASPSHATDNGSALSSPAHSAPSSASSTPNLPRTSTAPALQRQLSNASAPQPRSTKSTRAFGPTVGSSGNVFVRSQSMPRPVPPPNQPGSHPSSGSIIGNTRSNPTLASVRAQESASEQRRYSDPAPSPKGPSRGPLPNPKQ